MRKKLTLTIFGALFAFYSFSQSPVPLPSLKNVFQSGFEEGYESVWDDYDGNPDSENKIISDPEPFKKNRKSCDKACCPIWGTWRFRLDENFTLTEIYPNKVDKSVKVSLPNLVLETKYFKEKW